MWSYILFVLALLVLEQLVFSTIVILGIESLRSEDTHINHEEMCKGYTDLQQWFKKKTSQYDICERLLLINPESKGTGINKKADENSKIYL